MNRITISRAALVLGLSLYAASMAQAVEEAPECGNYVTEVGEQCDAGSAGSDCCSPNCQINPSCGCCETGINPTVTRTVAECYLSGPTTCEGTFFANSSCKPQGCEPLPVCGNGEIDAGEECDDGNTMNGDCCSSACQFDKQKTPCGDDGNSCTSEECDGKGQCVHEILKPLPKQCGCCEPQLDGRTVLVCSVTDSKSCSGSFHADSECTPKGCQGAVCGNGIVEEGEDCDPSRGTARGATPDCCNPDTCKFLQAGSACSDDENTCTNDQCDAQGECVHSNNTAPCDDADFCTGPDVCANGSCSGPATVPPSCNDNNGCTDDGCSLNACTNFNNTSTCDDGFFCTVNDICGNGSCQSGGERHCGAGSGCVISSCNEETDQCVSTPDPNQNGQTCDDANACTSGTTCAGGACAGGTTVTCDDSSACTDDSCNPASGCVFDTVVESPTCGSCEDGVDNDDDNDIDGEDCGCATLCAQQRFALVTTFVPSKFKRYAFYSGSDVRIGAATSPLPFPTGGACITNGTYRAGNDIGLLATTGSSQFGKGAALDPDLFDEEGGNDTGSVRITVVRQRFDSDGDPEEFKDVAPFVGPGMCSQNVAMMCAQDGDCGMGNTCDGQALLDSLANPYVDRTGTADNFTRCVNAQATVDDEAIAIAAIPGNVAGLDDGTAQLKTTAGTPMITVNVGPGQQVIHVNRVLISGKTVLRFVSTAGPGDPPTALVVRVNRQLRLGGEAEIQLQGMGPESLIWNVEGTRGGRPKLLRSSKFRGTLLAADRRGVLVGGLVTVDGAIKAKRIHLGQGTVVNHAPFKPLLVP